MIKKLADRFFKWYCRPEFHDDIRGDLEELYHRRVGEGSRLSADLGYLKEVLFLFRRSLVKPISPANPLFMTRSNLKIAFRHLTTEKLYSALKIGGFALGIAASLLLLLFITHELNFDTNYEDEERIFRLTSYHQEEQGWGAHFPAPLAQALVDDYPDVEMAGRRSVPLFRNAGNGYLRRSDRNENSYEEGFAYADQALLDILEVPFVAGDPNSALNEPNSMVIAESMAQKYFPHEDAIGKSLVINNDSSRLHTITGVMRDFPTNSHLQDKFFYTLSGVSYWDGEQHEWGSSNYSVYVRTEEGVDPAALEPKLEQIETKYILPRLLDLGMGQAQEIIDQQNFELQPVKDIYLEGEGMHDRLAHGDMRLVWLFIAACVLIMLIACINFINLSTARSAGRAREVGVRKVLGAFRGQLINQILVESVLFSMFSFVLGVLLAGALLPLFNDMAGRSLSLPMGEWWFFPAIIAAALAVGLFTGLYPSLYLSAFKPSKVLKGQKSLGNQQSGLRSGLVVFQFVMSIILLVGTFVIYRQMNFILDQKISLEDEKVILLKGTQNLGEKVFPFKEEIEKLPGVRSVSISDYLPIDGTKRNGNSVWRQGRREMDDPAFSQVWRVDPDYIPTLGIKVKEGRNLSEERSSDSEAIVINEALLRGLGLEEPIGTMIQNSGSAKWQVVGVVEDFPFESLREEISPLILILGQSTSIVSIKVSTSSMGPFISSLENTWKGFAPHQPIRYDFMDESYARMYADVKRSGSMFTSFSLLAIFIACLGLFGLTAYMSEQRTKEIGIRKVLGASVQQIVLLLSKDFIRLVLIAIVIATPIAWIVMQKWLQGFEYRTEMAWWIFPLAGIATLIIAFLTMSYHSVRDATGNPVEALRSE